MDFRGWERVFKCIQYGVWCIQCGVYNIFFYVYNVMYTIWNMVYTIWNVVYTIYFFMYTIYLCEKFRIFCNFMLCKMGDFCQMLSKKVAFWRNIPPLVVFGKKFSYNSLPFYKKNYFTTYFYITHPLSTAYVEACHLRTIMIFIFIWNDSPSHLLTIFIIIENNYHLLFIFIY